jgi:hypothetical protein
MASSPSQRTKVPRGSQAESPLLDSHPFPDCLLLFIGAAFTLLSDWIAGSSAGR